VPVNGLDDIAALANSRKGSEPVFAQLPADRARDRWQAPFLPTCKGLASRNARSEMTRGSAGACRRSTRPSPASAINADEREKRSDHRPRIDARASIEVTGPSSRVTSSLPLRERHGRCQSPVPGPSGFLRHRVLRAGPRPGRAGCFQAKQGGRLRALVRNRHTCGVDVAALSSAGRARGFAAVRD